VAVSIGNEANLAVLPATCSY